MTETKTLPDDMNPENTITSRYLVTIDETGYVNIDPLIASLISSKERDRIAMGVGALQLLRYLPDSTLVSLAKELDSAPNVMHNVLNRMGVRFDGTTNSTGGHWVIPDELQKPG